MAESAIEANQIESNGFEWNGFESNPHRTRHNLNAISFI